MHSIFLFYLGFTKILPDQVDLSEVNFLNKIGDVLVLKLFLSELGKRIAERFGTINPIDKMVELTQTPVFNTRPLKFGKYKGKTLAEIAEADKGYLSWMLGNMESLDEDMRYSITYVLERG